MAPAKTFHGARALFQIVDPSGVTQTVGIFNNCSYSLVYDVQPVFVLGRFSPAELGYVAQNAVQASCTGWKVLNHGAHQDGKVPHLQDLLNHEYLELQIVDRQTNVPVAKIHSVRPTGYSTTITARQLTEITVNFVGLLVDDESQPANAESVVPAGTGDLP
jgi:hypothetical protein